MSKMNEFPAMRIRLIDSNEFAHVRICSALKIWRMNPERPQQINPKGTNKIANRNANNDREVAISKKLSYFLRHGAVKEGLQITNDGWILVDEILQHKMMKSKGVKVEEIEVSFTVGFSSYQRQL